MKLLLGIPASKSAGDGYEPAENIKKIYDTIKNYSNFAGKNCYNFIFFLSISIVIGIMMWDAADAKRNNNFGQQIRNQCLS